MANKKKAQASKLTREYQESVRAKAKEANINWVDVREPNVNWVAVLVAAVVFVLGAVINRFVTGAWIEVNTTIAVITVLLSAFCLSAIKIANQWERVIVLRLGKFRCLKGPGPFFIIPIIDSLAQVVDMRIRTTDFRHSPRERRCDLFLDGLGCKKGHPGSAEFLSGHCAVCSNGPERYHWNA